MKIKELLYDHLTRSFRRWKKDEEAVVAAEFGLTYPLLIAMMLGMWDLGFGVVAAQKSIGAAHMVADLLSRQICITDEAVEQSIYAAQAVMAPMPVGENLEIEIASVYYDSNDNAVLKWSEVSNTTFDNALVDEADPLGTQGDGTVVVRIRYEYSPSFSYMFVGEMEFEEVAFIRGRKSPVVYRTPSCA